MTNQFGGDSVWTPEKVALIERLIGDGMTFAKAAAQVGVSKNAAIGKARRMGFVRRDDAVLTQMQLSHDGGRRLKEFSTLDQRLATINPFPEPGGCLYGVGDVGHAGFHFCGEQAKDGSPYCALHHSRIYRPEPPRER